MEADVLTTASLRTRQVTSLARQQALRKTRETGLVKQPPGLPLDDFTEFTTSADYIHSAELVNLRYSRQTLPVRIA